MMDNVTETEFQYGELVYMERQAKASFSWWKRELEGLIGRTLEPTEATTMYDMISGRLGV